MSQAESGPDEQANEPAEITFDEHLHPARPRASWNAAPPALAGGVLRSGHQHYIRRLRHGYCAVEPRRMTLRKGFGGLKSLYLN